MPFCFWQFSFCLGRGLPFPVFKAVTYCKMCSATLSARPSMISGVNTFDLLKADTLHTAGDVANLRHRNFYCFFQSLQFCHSHDFCC